MSYPSYLPGEPVAAADQLSALRDDLEQQESVIERGLESFIEIGRALAKIRDDRLYRHEYASFEVYCQSRWNLSRKRAYDLMSAATVVDGMEAALEMATSPIGDTPALPANEGQARELTGLDPAEAVDVMAKVNEATGVGRPRRRSVARSAAAGSIRNPTSMPRLRPSRSRSPPASPMPPSLNSTLPRRPPHRHNRPRRSVGPSQMLSTPRLST
ncbi:hypothetical protein SAMN04488548_12432 [Gordonia westfalica]|uniref:Uncharacterized protein n=1 Tax=Gordonia westfalica TaxID=158898 RepID=A0A1H2DWL1_9ACTN|nr:hypothetical protein SAMN04488548_12432 [Gordonia westfalica]